MKHIFLLITFFIFISSETFAQAPLSAFWEGEISYTWSSSEKWSHNMKLVARPYLYDNEDFNINLQRTEIQFFTSRKLFGGKQITGGYLFRWAEPFFEENFGYEHRLIQQYSFISFIDAKRLGSRIRLEQRFRNNKYINRLRYRLSFDFPLVGEQLDPGETYLIVSDEILFSFNSQETSLENRFYVGLGWYFNNKRKLETGLQYRSEDIGPDYGHVIQLVTSFYINR